MILLLVGLFLFYYGNQGSQIMTLISGNDQTHLFVGKLSPNLKAFSTFTLNYRDPDPRKRYLYLVIKKLSANNIREKGIQPDPISGHRQIKCLTVQQAQSVILTSEEVIVEIDPLKIKDEIRYEWDDHQNDLFPRVYGSIPAEAII